MAALSRTVCALLFCFLLIVQALANENWPQWRGPTGNGISDSKNLPTTWSLQSGENIVWKTELPSWSGGTPVIWGDHVFVTSPSKDDGTPPPPPERSGAFPGQGKGQGPGAKGQGPNGKGF